MSNPIWPLTLPQAVRINWTEEQTFNTIRSSVDVGPAKVRQRSTANVYKLSCSIMVKKTDALDQVQVYNDFLTNTLQGMTLQFDWKHPRTNAPTTFRMVSAAPYNNASSNGVYQLDFVMEKLP